MCERVLAIGALGTRRNMPASSDRVETVSNATPLVRKTVRRESHWSSFWDWSTVWSNSLAHFDKTMRPTSAARPLIPS